MIPGFQDFMRPLLVLLSNGDTLHVAELRDAAATVTGLSDDERREALPSGQLVYHGRVSWALSYMTRAALLERPARGRYRITERGRSILASHADRVDVDVLLQFPEFAEWIAQSRAGDSSGTTEPAAPTVSESTPEETLESAYLALRRTVESELLEQVKAMPPAFFERLVVELLVAMGYGGTLRDAGQAIGGSGDGGIDGIIKEDRLGLDLIYIQAKRWQGSVGRPVIQAFAGSLDGVRARKGIVLTTSSFTPDARRYVASIDKRIILIDGEQLASLMFEHGLGLTRIATYDVKRVDSDYFAEQ